MRWIRSLVWRMRSIVGRSRFDAELDRELQFHIDRHVQELVEQGLTPEAARHAAARTFGSVPGIQDECRDSFGFRALTDLRRDVVFAIRTMVRTPGFVVAVVSLALAVGATTASYGTVDWMFNRSSSAVREPDRLVLMHVIDRERPGWGPFGFAWQQYLALRTVQDGFVDIATFAKLAGVLSTETRSDQVVFEYVTGNYFSLLGVRPVIGRTLMPEDDVDGAPLVVVLSFDFWQSQFGGAPGVLDSPMRIDGQLARVVGVVPRTFGGFEMTWVGPSQVWLPMRASGAQISRMLTGTFSFFPIIGRMRPEMNLDVIRQKAGVWLANLPLLKMPTWTASSIVVTPPGEMRFGSNGGRYSMPFLGAVLMVSFLTLIAASFNLANFLLGRALDRRRELALRAAIGASRMRIVRQLLTEVTLLGLIASAFALMVTVGVARLLATLPSVYMSIVGSASELSTIQAIDTRMLGIAVMLGLVSATLFGLIPAVMGSPRDSMSTLKNPKPHWSWSGYRVTLRQCVLILQVALSIALAVTAGLYARSFLNAAAISPGYADPESVLVARLVATSIPSERRVPFYQSLFARLDGMPEVVSASIGWNPPLRIGFGPFSAVGREDESITTMATAAAPRFFETMGVPVLHGREFDGSQDELQNTVVINRVLAARVWPDEDPVGKLVTYARNTRQVIGVVAEERCADLLDEPQPCAWQPFALTSSSGYVRIRTRGSPLEFASRFRDVVHELDRDVALAEETTLDAHVKGPTRARQLSAVTSAALALFGVVLAAVGCVSLFQSMVKDSRREIAIRTALGATPGRLMRRVLLQGVLLTAAGVALGLVAARVIALRVADDLYQVGIADPMAFIAVPLFVATFGLAGVGYSALTATRTDPARYLQAE